MTEKLLVTETDWKTRVQDTAKLFGWRFAHFRPARTKHGWKTAMEGDKGFPDLVLVKPPRVIFAELKANDKSLPSVDQRAWLIALERCSVEAYIWTPSQWQDVYLTLAKDSRP